MKRNYGRFIDPLTDFGFKRLFGSEPNKDILIDFLNVPDAILEFNLPLQAPERYLRNASIFDSDLKEVFYNKLGFKFLELAKFVKTEQELESDLDRWCYLLKHMGHINKIPTVFRKQVFQKIFKIAALTKLTKEEKIMYDSSLKARWDYENTIAFAGDTAHKKGLEEGFKKGKEQGIELGKEEGIELGKEQGIELGKEQGIELGKEQGIELGKEQGINMGQYQQALSIALNMKLAGFDLEQISQLTNLTIEEVAAL